MNPFPNYGYQYHNGQPYSWYPQYFAMSYGQGQNLYDYYSAQAYNYAPKTTQSANEPNNTKRNEPDIIKVEQDEFQNQNGCSQKQLVPIKKPSQMAKRKNPLPRLSQVDKNIYVHPEKKVNTRVKYFDPNSAPVVTSSGYNSVEDLEKQLKRNMQISQLDQYNPNQLAFPEIDEDPFIVFRYRRIKKKFKKHIKSHANNYQGDKDQQSQSNKKHDDNSSSDSEDDSDEDYSQRAERARKRKKNKVKQFQRAQIKPKQQSEVLNISSSPNNKSLN